MKCFYRPSCIVVSFCLATLAPSCQASHGSRIRLSPVPYSSHIRGGASGGTRDSWSASPLGVRQRSQKQQQRYPIVEDADDEYEKQAAKDMVDAFLTRDSRNSFISRVYFILSGQLLVTALSIFLFGMNEGLSSWMRQAGAFVPWLSLGLSTFAWFLICSSARARRESPMKWQLLALFTLGESVAVGFISSFYTFRSVLNAMLATATASTTVSMYTILQKNPKYDLSQWGMGLSSAGVIFLVYGLIHLLTLFGVLPAGFLPYSDVIYSLVGAVLFSFYLAYHTKLIVSGKHTKYQMHEKDYVFGAMSLYNDVINLFIYILRIIGEDRDRN